MVSFYCAVHRSSVPVVTLKWTPRVLAASLSFSLFRPSAHVSHPLLYCKRSEPKKMSHGKDSTRAQEVVGRQEMDYRDRIVEDVKMLEPSLFYTHLC